MWVELTDQSVQAEGVGRDPSRYSERGDSRKSEQVMETYDGCITYQLPHFCKTKLKAVGVVGTDKKNNIWQGIRRRKDKYRNREYISPQLTKK